MRRRLLLGTVAAAAGLTIFCAQAGAVILPTPTGRASLAPHDDGRPSGRALSAGDDLTYHGGPVMHTTRSYAIFLDPASALPACYATLISRCLGDAAGDSGLSTNVYSVGTQYSDSTGRAGSSGSFGASLADGDAYPASGCPVAAGFTTCLTDAQLQTELDSFAAANSLPRGLDTLYHVFLPAPVDLCLDAETCFSNFFCAYHGYLGSAGTLLVYAALPYLADIAACTPGQHPNSAVRVPATTSSARSATRRTKRSRIRCSTPGTTPPTRRTRTNAGIRATTSAARWAERPGRSSTS